VAGQWFGLGAERLGLTGKVGAEAFLRLCENRHPASGETLTQRLNTTRMDEASRTTPPIAGFFTTSRFRRPNRFRLRRWPAQMTGFWKPMPMPSVRIEGI
jgi:hypothetical protein